MTTIAYKDGVMAADSGSWIGDVVHNGTVKIARDDAGTLYGVSGNAAECSAFLRWVGNVDRGPMPLPKETDPKEGESSFIVLIVYPDGEVKILSAYGTEDCGKLEFMSIGSGSAGAMCAMAVGANAPRAIQAVVDWANGAQGPVRYITRDNTVIRVIAKDDHESDRIDMPAKPAEITLAEEPKRHPATVKIGDYVLLASGTKTLGGANLKEQWARVLYVKEDDNLCQVELAPGQGTNAHPVPWVNAGYIKDVRPTEIFK